MNRKLRNDLNIDFRVLVQFALILCPFTFFFDAAVLFRGVINLSVPAVAILLFALNGGLLLLIIFSGMRYFAFWKGLKAEKSDDRLSRRKRLIEYLPVTVVATVFAVLAGLQFDTVPRFDGGLYYNSLITATDSFSYTFQSYVSEFTLIAHPMQGISLLIGAGEMLFPRQSVGLYGATLIISLIAIFCVYGIMGKIFPEKAPWMKAAGTAVFAFCPYVLGLFSHMSPDYFTLMLFVIFAYTFAEELDYLAAFLSVLLIFSRETGILFAASFLIPAILIRAARAEGKHFFAKCKRYLFPKRLLLYSVAPILFVYYSLFLKKLTYGVNSLHNSVFRWDNDGYLCFGFNSGYVSVRISQLLHFNFFWVITLLFVISFVVYILRRWDSKDKVQIGNTTDSALLSGIVMSSFAYLIFSCLFITIPCPRYAVCFAFPMALLSVGAISYIWKRQWVVKILMGGLVVLFLMQNYTNLDPSLSLGNEKIDLGYGYIYSPTGDYSFMQLSFLGEMYVYNRTFDYEEDLLDQAMEKINPDKDDHFLVIGIDWYEIYLIGDPLQTDHLIFWDPVHQRRTYDSSGEGTFLPNQETIPTNDLFSDKALDLPDDFYLILNAREAEEEYGKYIEERGYTIADSFCVKNYLGYLMVYHFSQSE